MNNGREMNIVIIIIKSSKNLILALFQYIYVIMHKAGNTA